MWSEFLWRWRGRVSQVLFGYLLCSLRLSFPQRSFLRPGRWGIDACNPGICLGKQYKVCEWVCSVRSISLWPCGLKPARLLCPWNFPGLEYQSRLPFPSSEGLPSPGMEPTSPVSPALAGRFFTRWPPGSYGTAFLFNLEKELPPQPLSGFETFFMSITVPCFFSGYSLSLDRCYFRTQVLNTQALSSGNVES